MRRHILAVALFCLAAPAFAEGTVDCSAPMTHADLMTCAGRTTAEAEQRMAETYEAALKIARDIDQAGGTVDNGIAASVRAAQSAWEGYRDAECQVAYVRTGGGQASDLEALGCRASLAEARQKDLQGTIDYLLLIL